MSLHQTSAWRTRAHALIIARLALGAWFAVGATCGCGSKTGLRIYGADIVWTDAYSPAEPRCLDVRVRTQVARATDLRVAIDGAASRMTGYGWSLRNGPVGTRALLDAPGGESARFTPDAPGAYDIGVGTPFAVADGGTLTCVIHVDADPVDPNCPGDPIVLPRIALVPGSTMQFAFDPAFGAVRAVSGDGGPASVSMIAADDPDADVAIAVIDMPATTDLESFARDIETRVQQILGATPVLVGRTGTIPEGTPYRRSTYRVATAAPTTADVARDRVARELLMLNPGTPRAGYRASSRFVVEVGASVRAVERRATVLFAVAREDRFDDPAQPTGSRLRDVTNATALAPRGRTLELVCRAVPTTRTVSADFLWLVDTSGSMTDDQERLGNAAERFFREMNSAGIDFRVGVVQAGSRSPIDLDSPGYEWISGADPNGPRQLAYTVTFRRYRDEPADRASPYPLAGGSEEPLAAGVLTTEGMERRAMTDPDDRRRFRAGATRVALFVTDEVGANDDLRYFAIDASRWGLTFEQRIQRVADWYRTHGFLTFALADVYSTTRCPTAENFIPCLVTLNGGAFIPIRTALDSEIASGLSQIADAIAAAASEFTLPQTPLSATVRIRLDDTPVPRSRANGFDLDDTGRTVVFRGNTFRPRRGQRVRGAYFTWR